MPSEQVNIDEAKTPLGPLERRPVKRVPGAWKGKGWISPDFDEPDEEMLDAMYNGPVFPDETRCGASSRSSIQ